MNNEDGPVSLLPPGASLLSLSQLSRRWSVRCLRLRTPSRRWLAAFMVQVGAFATSITLIASNPR